MDWIKAHVVALALGAIPVGFIASLLYQWLKKVVEKETELLANTPALVHRIYFAMTAVILTAIGTYFGVPIQCPEGASCLAAVNSQKYAELFVQGAVTILTGILTHKGIKAVKK